MPAGARAARLGRLVAAAERGDAAAQTELAEALFCSTLQPSDVPAPEQVREAVGDVIRRCDGDQRACACEMAERYGADPEGARDRMRWCRNAVSTTYVEPGDRGGSAYLRDLFWRRA